MQRDGREADLYLHWFLWVICKAHCFSPRLLRSYISYGSLPQQWKMEKFVTKTRFVTGRDIAASLKALINGYDQAHIAVAWGTENQLLEPLLSKKERVRQLVVGTHFYQTSPDFLEHIATSLPHSRVMAANGAPTFHPKVYVFRSKDRAAALVGSANFTRGGMASNVEGAILIESTVENPAIVDALSFVEEQWRQAEAIKPDFLRSYRLQYEATADARKRLTSFVRLKTPVPTKRVEDLLAMGWTDFEKLVRADRTHDFRERLDVLSAARNLFGSVKQFKDLDELQRKAIAGTIGVRESSDSNVHWAWFGSMRGAGVFKSAINSEPGAISSALDEIPSTGAVTESDFHAYAKKFRRVFQDKVRSSGLPPASRLLAMKRPDYFVCYDGPNASALARYFGFSKATLNPPLSG